MGREYDPNTHVPIPIELAETVANYLHRLAFTDDQMAKLVSSTERFLRTSHDKRKRLTPPKAPGDETSRH